MFPASESIRSKSTERGQEEKGEKNPIFLNEQPAAIRVDHPALFLSRRGTRPNPLSTPIDGWGCLGEALSRQVTSVRALASARPQIPPSAPGASPGYGRTCQNLVDFGRNHYDGAAACGEVADDLCSISRFAPTSTPRVGSSRSRTFGCRRNHFASTIFCSLPPDRPETAICHGRPNVETRSHRRAGRPAPRASA